MKFVDRCNPQELSVVTRKRVARHGYPPGDLLLPFGQFTLCRACGDEAAGVAVRNLALRRGREMGAQCAPLSLSKKQHFDSCTSCGSTHKIEFAEQIHKFREHVSRNLYKGIKNVPARRVFSSKFDRKRGFDREAARKTLVFRQPHGRTMCAPTEEKILCRSHFSERSPVSGLRQAIQGKRGDSQEGGKPQVVYPLVRPRGVSAFLRFATDAAVFFSPALCYNKKQGDEKPCRSKFDSTSSVTLHRQQKFGTRSLRTVKPFRRWKSWTR